MEGNAMNSEGGCCGGNLFTSLEPAKQAEYLALLAHEARLLQCSLESEDPVTRRIGDRLQRALEQAMDADAPDEAEGAQRELEQALTGAHDAGMVLSAELGEMDVEGALGTMRMRVLTTVLAPQPQDA
ncbi:MAG: hypothetical protein OEW34_14395 [Burkholderiaceae bacterium]|jgi:hypothetical protein|nr:hypothetical protein [Burkholderiaceae bacterium]